TFIAVAGDIPATAFVIDAVRHFPVVAQEKTDRHTEDFLDFTFVGAQLEHIRHYAHIGGHLDAEARYQAAQRPDNLNQVRYQADFLMGFTQGGEVQIHITGAAPATAARHL